jgi:hypothetical protein
MATEAFETIPKISVKIWRPIINRLRKKLDSACLRRDPYLSRVLDVELDWLDQEVSIPNSQASYEHVFAKLDQLDRKLVLALPRELTKRLTDICLRKRIVRDAFFNRLLLLLAAPPHLIDMLLFGDRADEWRETVWSEYKHDGPFFQNGFYPLEPMIDPFWAVRTGLERYRGDGLEDYLEPSSGKIVRVQRSISDCVSPADSLYTIAFREVGKVDLTGMNCYLPDWLVPGNQGEKDHQAAGDKLLAEFEVLP